MDNIYKAPEAKLDNDSAEKTNDFALYKVSGIGLATFFASALAGGVLMAINFKRLGDEVKARNTIIYSLIATVFIFALAFIIPEDMQIPNIIFTVVQVVVMVQLTKQLQGKDILVHTASGGQLASNWKAFGISVLVLLGLMAVFVPVAMVFVV